MISRLRFRIAIAAMALLVVLSAGRADQFQTLMRHLTTSFANKVQLCDTEPGLGGTCVAFLQVDKVAHTFSVLYPEAPAAHGAAVDGAADDAVAVQATATAGGAVTFQRGATRIATAMILTVPIGFDPGGTITVDGVGLTIAAGFQAPLRKVFNLVNGGFVVFTNTALTRYPEWFGATPFSSSPASATINTAAINAAIAAGPGTLEFVGASYTRDGALIDLQPRLNIIGRGDQTTTLHLTSATADEIDVGAQSGNAPGGFYGSLRHLLFIRDVAPSVGFGAYPYTQPAKGVSLRNVAFFEEEDVHVYRSRIGFYQRATTNVFIKRPIAEFNFTVDGGDAIGYFIDGQDDPYPGTGLTANASTTIQDALAFCSNSSGATILSAGFRIQANFADQFLTNPQTAGGCNGIDIEGQGAVAFNHRSLGGAIVPAGATSSTPEAAFTVDLTITNPILDGFPNYAIRVNNVPANTPAISINGGYVLHGGGVAAAALDFENSNGISVTGGLQCIAWFGSTGDYCISMVNVREIVVDASVHLIGAGNPVVGVGVAGSEISPTIQNFDNRGVANPAVKLQNAGYNHIAPAVDCFTTGGATVTGGCFASALNLIGTTNSPSNAIDLTKALPYAFPGGLTILTVDGTNYTSSGTKHFGNTVGAGNSIITGSQP